MTTTRQGPRGRNARGEASLQRILGATVELVGRYGYDNTTIARITKATQRPASSIYWYFEDKDDLIARALENSYSSSTRTRRSWQDLDASLPLQVQLTEQFESELRASESEAPLRLGIMLALEGSAAQSKVQEPFRRRRVRALSSFEQWWGAAFAQHRADGERRETGTWWMSTLTLAFLDGHYISDVIADETAVITRSRIVALALTAAFDVLRDSCASASNTSTGTAALPEDTIAASDSDSTELLRMTRDLVAEHGYEGATIGRICASTGMQRSSVYWRYKDKDALIKAAVAEPFVALFSPLYTLPTTTDAWADVLASAMVEVLRTARSEPSTIKAGLLLKVQKWDPQTSGSAVLEGTAAAEKVLAAWFTTVLPENHGELIGEHLAWTVTRLLEGLMFGSVSGRPPVIEAVHGLFEAMFDGVVTRW